MKTPPHPGHILRRRVMPAMMAPDSAALAQILDLPEGDIQAVIDGRMPIDQIFAERLEAAGIGNERHWLTMQGAFEKQRATHIAEYSNVWEALYGESVTAYPIRIMPDSVGYMATCRDIPELTAAGNNEDEAWKNAVEILQTTLDTYRSEGCQLPPPSKPQKGEHTVPLLF